MVWFSKPESNFAWFSSRFDLAPCKMIQSMAFLAHEPRTVNFDFDDLGLMKRAMLR